MSNIKPLGIKIFGIGNIIIGLIFSITSSFFFYAATVSLWIGDSKPKGYVEWFSSAFIERLAIISFFVFSFQLIHCGVVLLMMDPKARKMSKVTSKVVISVMLLSLLNSVVLTVVYPKQSHISFSFLDIIVGAFILYTIILNIYLNRLSIRELFNDQQIKLSFIRPILIIIISFLLPFIFNLFFPTLFPLYIKTNSF